MAGCDFSFPEVVQELYIPSFKKMPALWSAPQQPKKLLGTGNKNTQIVFAGDVGVWEIAGTKNIFLIQEVVVGVVSSVGF